MADAAAATVGRAAHRIGGVPLVFVAAGVGVGVLVLWRRKPAAAPAPATDQATGDAAAPVTATSPSYLVVGNNAAPPISGTPAPPAPTAPTDNVTWQRQAETQLIAGGYDPILVDQALSLYLTGQSLTQQQGAVVSLALARFGPPPSPPAPPIVQTPAPSTGGNTGTSGDTGTTTAPAPTGTTIRTVIGFAPVTGDQYVQNPDGSYQQRVGAPIYGEVPVNPLPTTPTDWAAVAQRQRLLFGV